MIDEKISKLEEKEKTPSEDVLTPLGELFWRDSDKDGEICADEMFGTSPIAGSAGVEC
jgi:hypothetical protein